MRQGLMGIGIPGRRQVTPRWAIDPVWLYGVSRQESGQGQVQAPPPPRRKSGGGRRSPNWVNKSGVAYVTINDGA